MTRLCGLFLECDATQNNGQSFFSPAFEVEDFSAVLGQRIHARISCTYQENIATPCHFPQMAATTNCDPEEPCNVAF